MTMRSDHYPERSHRELDPVVVAWSRMDASVHIARQAVAPEPTRQQRAANVPPAVAAALRLQRAIGNRACTRLLARQPGTAAAGAAAKPKVELPTFTVTAKNDWLRDPDPLKPHKKDFGLTTVTTVGGSMPKFQVAPAPGGGVVVQPTEAWIKPIEVQHVAPGRYPEENPINYRPDRDRFRVYYQKQPSGFPTYWDVTRDGAEKLKAGEMEHVVDYQYAFYLSVFRFAEIVNEMAATGTRYASEADARKVLDGQVLIDESKLVTYFAELCEQTRKIRDVSPGARPSHTPVRAVSETPVYDDATHQYIGSIPLTAGSLTLLGRGIPDVVMQAAAAPECLQLTRIKP